MKNTGGTANIFMRVGNLYWTASIMIDLAQFEARYLELNEESVDVEEVVQEALRITMPEVATRRITLTSVQSTTKLPDLYCDRERLRNVLVKILSEAPRIEISTEIADSLDIIIKEFSSRRADINSAALTWARVLMERHGGHCSIESTPNFDITVRLSFPPERIRPIP